MPTINEDLFESQCTTTMHKTRNNEDLKEVTDMKSSGKDHFMDFSDLSNIKDQSKVNQNSPVNYTFKDETRPRKLNKQRRTPIKTIDPFSMKSKSKSRPMKRDYSKILEEFQNNSKSKLNNKLKLNTGHEITSKKSVSKSLKRLQYKPSTTKNSSKNRFLLASFENTIKSPIYTGNSGEKAYVRQTNQKKQSYQDAFAKYKKRHKSLAPPSFKPKINPHSKWVLDEKAYNSLERSMNDHKNPRGSNFSSFTCKNTRPLKMNDLSTSREKLMDRSRDEYLKLKQRMKKNDCTFKPKINYHSKKLASSKRGKSANSENSNSQIKRQN